MSKQIEMTQEAFDKLEKELMDMKALRPEIAQEIQEARSHGDLSENSEYDAALDKQAKHEERIAALEEMKKHAKIIDESSIKKGVVSVGSVVGVHDFDLEEDVEYIIVSAIESDPLATPAKVSDQSPIGKALLGCKKGAEVTVEIPNGESYKLKVLSVGRADKR